jgi:hypothetical protein
MKTGEGPAEPYLIAANHNSIKAFSILRQETRDVVQLPSGATVAGGSGENFSTLGADGHAVYYLEQRGEKLILSASDFSTGKKREWETGESVLAGPFQCGGRTCAYSREAFYIIQGDTLRSYRFGRFAARMSPRERTELHCQTGRVPYLVKRSSVYIPGEQTSAAGLLLLSLAGAEPEPTFLPIHKETTYTQDLEGSPLLAQDGQVLALRGAAEVRILADDAIEGRRPAFNQGAFSAAFVRRAGSEWIRFFSGQTILNDVSLSPLKDLSEVYGIDSMVSSVVVSYVDSGNRMGMAIWDL